MNNYYKYQMPIMDMNYMNDPSNMMYDMNSVIPNTNMYNTNNISPKTYNSYQGFIRGNMFEKLYDPYKNYKFAELKATNERISMLQKIQEYDFALVDLDLYLDVFPKDDQMIKKYNEYRTTLANLKEQYQNIYGPLSLSSNALNNTPWAWLSGQWPWEVQS